MYVSIIYVVKIIIIIRMFGNKQTSSVKYVLMFAYLLVIFLINVLRVWNKIPILLLFIYSDLVACLCEPKETDGLYVLFIDSRAFVLTLGFPLDFVHVKSHLFASVEVVASVDWYKFEWLHLALGFVCCVCVFIVFVLFYLFF